MFILFLFIAIFIALLPYVLFGGFYFFVTSIYINECLYGKDGYRSVLVYFSLFHHYYLGKLFINEWIGLLFAFLHLLPFVGFTAIFALGSLQGDALFTAIKVYGAFMIILETIACIKIFKYFPKPTKKQT